eukprot:174473-Prorocentrum_minimum.AAC.7
MGVLPIAEGPAAPSLEIHLSDLELRGLFNPEDIDFMSTTIIQWSKTQGRQRPELNVSSATNSVLRIFVTSLLSELPSVVEVTFGALLQVLLFRCLSRVSSVECGTGREVLCRIAIACPNPLLVQRASPTWSRHLIALIAEHLRFFVACSVSWRTLPRTCSDASRVTTRGGRASTAPPPPSVCGFKRTNSKGASPPPT